MEKGAIFHRCFDVFHQFTWPSTSFRPENYEPSCSSNRSHIETFHNAENSHIRQSFKQIFEIIQLFFFAHLSLRKFQICEFGTFDPWILLEIDGNVVAGYDFYIIIEIEGLANNTWAHIARVFIFPTCIATKIDETIVLFSVIKSNFIGITSRLDHWAMEQAV